MPESSFLTIYLPVIKPFWKPHKKFGPNTQSQRDHFLLYIYQSLNHFGSLIRSLVQILMPESSFLIIYLPVIKPFWKPNKKFGPDTQSQRDHHFLLYIYLSLNHFGSLIRSLVQILKARIIISYYIFTCHKTIWKPNKKFGPDTQSQNHHFLLYIYQSLNHFGSLIRSLVQILKARIIISYYIFTCH